MAARERLKEGERDRASGIFVNIECVRELCWNCLIHLTTDRRIVVETQYAQMHDGMGTSINCFLLNCCCCSLLLFVSLQEHTNSIALFVDFFFVVFKVYAILNCLPLRMSQLHNNITLCHTIDSCLCLCDTQTAAQNWILINPNNKIQQFHFWFKAHSGVHLGRAMTTANRTKTKLKAILIDLSGTLHIDDEPTPNSVVALDRFVVIETLKFYCLRLFNRFNVRGHFSLCSYGTSGI